MLWKTNKCLGIFLIYRIFWQSQICNTRTKVVFKISIKICCLKLQTLPYFMVTFTALEVGFILILRLYRFPRKIFSTTFAFWTNIFYLKWFKCIVEYWPWIWRLSIVCWISLFQIDVWVGLNGASGKVQFAIVHKDSLHIYSWFVISD